MLRILFAQMGIWWSSLTVRWTVIRFGNGCAGGQCLASVGLTFSAMNSEFHGARAGREQLILYTCTVQIPIKGPLSFAILGAKIPDLTRFVSGVSGSASQMHRLEILY